MVEWIERWTDDLGVLSSVLPGFHAVTGAENDSQAGAPIIGKERDCLFSKIK